MIKIRAFRAIDDKATVDRYIEGHRQVLETYGVTRVTSGVIDWVNDPDTYLVIVESLEDGKVLGGGRIQIRTHNLKMPMEDAIAILDERIYEYVETIGNHNVAEFCGLWNSREVAGFGIGSIYLGRIGVAVTKQLGVGNLMALCSPATLKNCLKVGFRIITELGNNGTFYYPKEDLTATALIIEDLENLNHANPFEKIEIYKIRNNLSGTSVEHGPKGEVEFFYELEIPNKI